MFEKEKYRKSFNISYSSLEAISSWSRETNTPLKSASILLPRDNHFLDIRRYTVNKILLYRENYMKIHQKILYQKIKEKKFLQLIKMK